MSKVLENLEILLVEDNPADAKLTIRNLEKHKLSGKVMWVKDGAEAMDFVFARGTYHKRNPQNLPKLILLDINMPKIGGFEFLENIRLNKLTKEIPVIMLTVSKRDRDRIKSQELGAISYLQKPVDEAGFIEAVKEVGLYWYFVGRPPGAVNL